MAVGNAVTIAKAIIEVGAQGVDAAENEMLDLQLALKALGDQLDKDQIKFSDYAKRAAGYERQIKDIADGLQLASTAATKYSTTQEAIASLHAKATTNTKNYQQAALAASYALQDFTSANGGLLQQFASMNNNIPQITAGLGGPAGVAAAVGAVTTVVIAAAAPIAEFGKGLLEAGNEANKFTGSLDSLKARLDEISKKPHKVSFDYEQIDDLNKRIETTEDAIRRVESMKSQLTNTQEKVAKAVKGVVVEQSGGTDEESGVENLQKLIKEAVGGDLKNAHIRSGELASLEKEAGIQERFAKSSGLTPEQTAVALKEAQRLKKKRDDLRREIDEKVNDDISVLVGRALKGVDDARVEITKIYDENTELFTEGAPHRGARPVSPLFRFSLEQASPEKIKQAEADKRDIDRQIRMARLNKDLDTKKKKDAAEAKRKSDEEDRKQAEKATPIISAFVKGRGLEDTATKLLEEMERNRAVGPDGQPMSPQQQMEAIQSEIRSVIEEELKSRGLLNKGSGKAAGTAATQLAAKARSNLDQAADKAKTQIKQELSKDISQTASSFGPKINDELQAAILNRMAKGQQDAVIQRDLAKQLSERMGGAGVTDPRVAEGAASQIVEKALGGLRMDLQFEGPSVQEAAQNRLGDLIRNINAKAFKTEDARKVDALSRMIQENVPNQFGVPLTDDQSQAIARKTVGMVNQGVNVNAALQMSLQEQLGAMNALSNQQMQQGNMLRMLAQEYQMLRRGIQTRQRTAQKRG